MFKTMIVCGRQVDSATIEDAFYMEGKVGPERFPHFTCTDCGTTAKYIMREDDGKMWFYCGDCEVG